MKFLIDAQLPQKFVGWLEDQGLEYLLKANLNAIVKAFEDNCFIEITFDGLIIHE
jgi:predicted nuclease of predicted toxin-antitoxin system